MFFRFSQQFRRSSRLILSVGASIAAVFLVVAIYSSSSDLTNTRTPMRKLLPSPIYTISPLLPGAKTKIAPKIKRIPLVSPTHKPTNGDSKDLPPCHLALIEFIARHVTLTEQTVGGLKNKLTALPCLDYDERELFLKENLDQGSYTIVHSQLEQNADEIFCDIQLRRMLSLASQYKLTEQEQELLRALPNCQQQSSRDYEQWRELIAPQLSELANGQFRTAVEALLNETPTVVNGAVRLDAMLIAPNEVQDESTERMSLLLKLTTDQKHSYRDLTVEAGEQYQRILSARTVGGGNVTPEIIRESFLVVRKDFTEKLKRILTPTQAELYDQEVSNSPLERQGLW